MNDLTSFNALSTTRQAIRYAAEKSESAVVADLLEAYDVSDEERRTFLLEGGQLIARSRGRSSHRSLLDHFMQEFGLSNQEGVALMCLAEALLRVPDKATADSLISEKLGQGAWDQHVGKSGSPFVNAATWGLMLTGGVLKLDRDITRNPVAWIRALVARLGEPVVRAAVGQAMKILGQEFVLGRTIQEALRRARKNPGNLYSFDMLGEGARTHEDAAAYLEAYKIAIAEIGADICSRGVGEEGGVPTPCNTNGISVKISALHPRYEYMQKARSFDAIYSSLKELALAARTYGMHLTIDAEEAARLEYSLDLITRLASDPDLSDWDGLGFALQCYSKRALPVLNWVIALSEQAKRRFMVRFVKGAYWDAEIKVAQEKGLSSFPVFTRKCNTDLSYLACARRALQHSANIYPQFATHNAVTLAAIMEMAGDHRDFEFQRLHGMGDLLYRIAGEQYSGFPQVRVYAPVGRHKELLAYLVRRLLENGANSSFVNRFLDERVPIEAIACDPVEQVRSHSEYSHPGIVAADHMFGEERENSKGYDLDDATTVEDLLAGVEKYKAQRWMAGPLIKGVVIGENPREVVNPANRDDIVGFVSSATESQARDAVTIAQDAQKHWDRVGGAQRARILEAAADSIEKARAAFTSLLIREAGKTYRDTEAEIREAIDFCRYYAAQARREFDAGRVLPSPSGEQNLYSLHGRGVFICISPWNFPLAIFVGQVVAALAAGNAVVAKPAEQTPLVAFEVIKILHQSGVPEDVLHFLPGTGSIVGAALTADPNIAGVAMTGSTVTAKVIARTIAERWGAIIPLIAETGGQNAMFVDSTALPEQVVDDVIRSAFHSAGQRCSALRLLYLQEDIADQIIHLIKGAMDTLEVGDPHAFTTDVGPVIDAGAQSKLLRHVEEMKAQGRLLHCVEVDAAVMERGAYVPPHLFEIDRAGDLCCEHFGPLLHVIRYRTDELEGKLAELASTGYGLTVGVHSRLQQTADLVFDCSLAGNAYINRNTIGAVVGVQPFGGQGLSGTGPKAGGPLYLYRFATERVRTTNTMATGGNAELLRMI